MGEKPGFIKKGDAGKLKLPARRPGYTPLENFSWNLSGFPRMRPWRDAVIDFLEELPD